MENLCWKRFPHALPNCPQSLFKSFKHIQFGNISGMQNRHTDALAIRHPRLTSLARLLMWVSFVRLYEPLQRTESLSKIGASPLFKNLTQPSSTMVTRELKDFTVINGELYYRGSDGVMARAISITEAKEEFQGVQRLSCAVKNISLSRDLRRQGYYGPKMAKRLLGCNQPVHSVRSP